MAETGYLDMEGRWQKLENTQRRVTHGPTPHIHISDRMIKVLCLLFQGEYPYRVYGQVAKDTSQEEDRAFDTEVKALEIYFSNQQKGSGK